MGSFRRHERGAARSLAALEATSDAAVQITAVALAMGAAAQMAAAIAMKDLQGPIARSLHARIVMERNVRQDEWSLPL